MSLSSNFEAFASRVATEFNALRASIGALTGLSTTHKTTIVGAVNEVRTLADTASTLASSAATIDDATVSTTKTLSSSKINTNISDAVAGIVSSAPATLDTLNELADALGDDPNFATTMATALGNRVRVDAAQALTAPQMLQARTNIDAVSATAVGDTSIDLVAVFEAALA